MALKSKASRLLTVGKRAALMRRSTMRPSRSIFSELQSHYLFADRFGRPGKGNDKGEVGGKVEGLIGCAHRNFGGRRPKGQLPGQGGRPQFPEREGSLTDS